MLLKTVPNIRGLAITFVVSDNFTASEIIAFLVVVIALSC